MAKGYTTNSGIFAKRGDPWVSAREGREKFGRNLDSEDPDIDQFFATKAKPKEKFIDPPKPEKAEASYSLRKANIILRAKAQSKSEFKPNPDDDNPFERFSSGGVKKDG